MADSYEREYLICYLDPDGRWTYSALKSDFKAIAFRDYGSYLIPCEFFD
jgi:hypothetical protein